MMLLDITDSNVYDALAQFMALVVPQGTTVQRGQQNRVSMPSGPCVILTTIGAPRRIGTNDERTMTNAAWTADSYITADSDITADSGGDGDGFITAIMADFEYYVQADFYSPDAERWAMSAELLWRSKLGWYSMPPGIKPLYSEGRQQLPLLAGENQWVQRWTLTLVVDYQPTLVQDPAQAAITAGVVPEPIDVFYPSIWTTQ